MTFFEWFQKVNNTSIDLDGQFGAQCMDEMHSYCSDVLGLDKGVLSAPAAKQVFQNFNLMNGHEQFDKIINRPWNVPKQGDIIFFGGGLYGHVAIFNEGNVFHFTSIDQNWPLGSSVHVQSHSYYKDGVLGWLRYKNTPAKGA